MFLLYNVSICLSLFLSLINYISGPSAWTHSPPFRISFNVASLSEDNRSLFENVLLGLVARGVKTPAMQGYQPGFDPQNPYTNGRRELTLQNCPLTCTWKSSNICMHTWFLKCDFFFNRSFPLASNFSIVVLKCVVIVFCQASSKDLTWSYLCLYLSPLAPEGYLYS